METKVSLDSGWISFFSGPFLGIDGVLRYNSTDERRRFLLAIMALIAGGVSAEDDIRRDEMRVMRIMTVCINEKQPIFINRCCLSWRLPPSCKMHPRAKCEAHLRCYLNISWHMTPF